MNLAFIILLSLFISLTWVYYFKLVDIFEREKFIYLGLTFIISTVIPNIIYPIHDYIYNPFGITNSSNPVASFLFFTLGVGFLEECIKVLPVIILLRFTGKKAINEPLDYVVYACISALGFAFGENVEYANYYGHDVLLDRSVLSVPAHMFFSAIFIYGYVLYKFNNKPVKSIVHYACIGFTAHGLYDYLLDFKNQGLGIFLMLLFFTLLISAFSTIINNGLNNSPFYTPKKSIHQEKIRSRISFLYSIIILAIIFYYSVLKGVDSAIGTVFAFLFFKSMILLIIIVRLSRFSIIPGVWKPVRIEFPFYINHKNERDEFVFFFGMLSVRGGSYSDYHISKLYGEDIMVIPINKYQGALKKAHAGRIEQKLFIEDMPVFVVRVFLDESKILFKRYHLIPKSTGKTHAEGNNPIASLNSPHNDDKSKLVFHEWVVLKQKV